MSSKCKRNTCLHTIISLCTIGLNAFICLICPQKSLSCHPMTWTSWRASRKAPLSGLVFSVSPACSVSGECCVWSARREVFEPFSSPSLSPCPLSSTLPYFCLWSCSFTEWLACHSSCTSRGRRGLMTCSTLRRSTAVCSSSFTCLPQRAGIRSSRDWGLIYLLLIWWVT